MILDRFVSAQALPQTPPKGFYPLESHSLIVKLQSLTCQCFHAMGKTHCMETLTSKSLKLNDYGMGFQRVKTLWRGLGQGPNQMRNVS